MHTDFRLLLVELKVKGAHWAGLGWTCSVFSLWKPDRSYFLRQKKGWEKLAVLLKSSDIPINHPSTFVSLSKVSATWPSTVEGDGEGTPPSGRWSTAQEETSLWREGANCLFFLFFLQGILLLPQMLTLPGTGLRNPGPSDIITCVLLSSVQRLRIKVLSCDSFPANTQLTRGCSKETY